MSLQFSVTAFHALDVDQYGYTALQNKPHGSGSFTASSLNVSSMSSGRIRRAKAFDSPDGWPRLIGWLPKPRTTAGWEPIIDGFTVKNLPSDFKDLAFSCIPPAAKISNNP